MTTESAVAVSIIIAAAFILAVFWYLVTGSDKTPSSASTELDNPDPHQEPAPLATPNEDIQTWLSILGRFALGVFVVFLVVTGKVLFMDQARKGRGPWVLLWAVAVIVAIALIVLAYRKRAIPRLLRGAQRVTVQTAVRWTDSIKKDVEDARAPAAEKRDDVST